MADLKWRKPELSDKSAKKFIDLLLLSCKSVEEGVGRELPGAAVPSCKYFNTSAYTLFLVLDQIYCKIIYMSSSGSALMW